MRDGYKVFDADAHVIYPKDLWQRYLPERFRSFADYRPLAVGLALVIVMILRPQGLIPSRRRARELHDRQEEAAVDVVA